MPSPLSPQRMGEDGKNIRLGEGHFPNSIRLAKFKFKNDWNRTGVWLPLFSCQEQRLCPIAALWEYCQRTNQHRRRSNFIFIDTSHPFAPIKAGTVSNLLKRVIQESGISTDIFSACHFRSGGATALIKGGVRPGIVMKLGAWRDVQTFFNNYVATEELQSDHYDLLFAS